MMVRPIKPISVRNVNANNITGRQLEWVTKTIPANALTMF